MDEASWSYSEPSLGPQKFGNVRVAQVELLHGTAIFELSYDESILVEASRILHQMVRWIGSYGPNEGTCSDDTPFELIQDAEDTDNQTKTMRTQMLMNEVEDVYGMES